MFCYKQNINCPTVLEKCFLYRMNFEKEVDKNKKKF